MSDRMGHSAFTIPDTRRTWHQVGIAPLRRRADLTIAQEVWELDVIGVRSDGNQFTITVTLLPEQMKAPGPEIALGFHHQLMVAFARLEGYRTCDCDGKLELVCRIHSQPESHDKPS